MFCYQGKPFEELFRPEDRARAKENKLRILEGKEALCPVPMQDKDGKLLWAVTSMGYGEWCGERVIIAMVREVTALRALDGRSPLMNAV